MKAKLDSLLNGSKKSVTVAAVCGALTLTIGAGAVFAAKAADDHDAVQTKQENSLEASVSDNRSLTITGEAANGHPGIEKGKIMMRNDNGVSSYSTDDGQTWTPGTPKGAVITKTKDGGTLVTMGTPPKEGEGRSLMAKKVNGITSYSTDGGKTWSENVPEGFDEIVSADGSAGIKKIK